MDKQRRYTAQELRDAAEYMSDSIRDIRDGNDSLWPKDSDTPKDWEAMLRQAADAEEELAKVKASKNRWMRHQETAAGERNACIDELREKDAEIAKLKARLEAVVKECEEVLTNVKGCITRDCTSDCALAEDCANDHVGCLCEKKINDLMANLRAACGEGSAPQQA